MQIMPIVDITNNSSTGIGLCVRVGGVSETLSLDKAREFRDALIRMVRLLDQFLADAEKTR